MTIHDRVAIEVDHAEVERASREQTARENAERREFLYGRLFGNVALDRDVSCLRTESAATELLRSSVRGDFDNRRQVQILRVAVDNRWASVVHAFIKVWNGEHPIAQTVQELWSLTLTTGRTST